MRKEQLVICKSHNAAIAEEGRVMIMDQPVIPCIIPVR